MGVPISLINELQRRNNQERDARAGLTLPRDITVKPAIAEMLHLVSVGKTGGLYNSAHPKRSIFVNNNQVESDEGTTVLEPFDYEQRDGSTGQAALEGMPATVTFFNIQQNLTHDTPYTHNLSGSDIDIAHVIVRFPAGLYHTSKKGKRKATPISLTFQRKLVADGSWTTVKTMYAESKADEKFDVEVGIKRPSGAGTWQIRVVRDTEDNTDGKTIDLTQVYGVEEILNDTSTYDGNTVIRTLIDTNTVGTDFPSINFDIAGLLCRVPSNYDPDTHTYTGEWDLEFSETKVSTSNPFWIVLELLTNPDVGIGDKIDDTVIDLGSFYDAAVYADGQVNALVNGEVSGTERRFTFDFQFMDQKVAPLRIQDICAVGNAYVQVIEGLLTVIQDRPVSGPYRQLSNLDIIAGNVSYTQAGLTTQWNEVNTWYHDKNENWLEKNVTYSNYELSPFSDVRSTEYRFDGITSEGQALRGAKNMLYTNTLQQWTAGFKLSIAHADITEGEVVEIYDERWAGVKLTARKAATGSTSSSLKLDRPITVLNGETFKILDDDGETWLQRTITANSTGDTVSYSGGDISAKINPNIYFQRAIVGKPWKIVEKRRVSELEFEFLAIEYDANKYALIDDTPVGITPSYTQNFEVAAPENLSAEQHAFINDDNTVHQQLVLTWDRPGTVVRGYQIHLSVGDSAPIGTWGCTQTSFTLDIPYDAYYKVEVRAIGFGGRVSEPAVLYYTYNSIDPDADNDFDAVTTLVDFTDGGTIFNTDDLKFKFLNPSSNSTNPLALKDFWVQILDLSDNVVREFALDPVEPGEYQTGEYLYQDNLDDNNGVPERKFKVRVYLRDGFNRKNTTPTTVTFNNPPPGIPPGLNIVAGLSSVVITFDLPGVKDFEGVLIWRSTDIGFVPSIDNLIYDGTDSYVVDSNVTANAPVYYIVGCYDSFWKSYDGTGLVISSNIKVTVVGDGNDNLARNSDMFARDTAEFLEDGVTANPNRYRPYQWWGFQYDTSYADMGVEYVDRTGLGSDTSLAFKCVDATDALYMGFNTVNWYAPTETVAIPPWETGVDYTLSFYAKKENGANLTTMALGLDVLPDTVEYLLNPDLSTEWQRYAVHFKWDGTTDSNYLFVLFHGTPEVDDVLLIDRIQLEKASSYSGWTPRLEELLPGSITEVYIADDAIITPKLAALAVTGDKIAGNTIIAREKIVVGSIDKAQLQTSGDVNMLDTSKWVPGVALSALARNDEGTDYGWYSDSDSAKRSWVLTTGPSGHVVTAFKATSNDAYTSGEQNDGVIYTGLIPIDITKTYRLSVWFKPSGDFTNGIVVGGNSYGYTATGIDSELNDVAGSLAPDTGVVTWRPDQGTADRWYLAVMYIFPYGTTGADPDTAGVYDGTTQIQILPGSIGANKVFKATTNYIGFTCGQYNAANGAITYFWNPRVEMCDGNEPTLESILATGGVSGRNPINTANQDVIIEDGAITAPKMNVVELSAITGTIGLCRTATSGERVEIADNQITVYDSSNAVRVKIGDLS